MRHAVAAAAAVTLLLLVLFPGADGASEAVAAAAAAAPDDSSDDVCLTRAEAEGMRVWDRPRYEGTGVGGFLAGGAEVALRALCRVREERDGVCVGVGHDTCLGLATVALVELLVGETRVLSNLRTDTGRGRCVRSVVAAAVLGGGGASGGGGYGEDLIEKKPRSALTPLVAPPTPCVAALFESAGIYAWRGVATVGAETAGDESEEDGDDDDRLFGYFRPLMWGDGGEAADSGRPQQQRATRPSSVTVTGSAEEDAPTPAPPPTPPQPFAYYPPQAPYNLSARVDMRRELRGVLGRVDASYRAGCFPEQSSGEAVRRILLEPPLSPTPPPTHREDVEAEAAVDVLRVTVRRHYTYKGAPPGADRVVTGGAVLLLQPDNPLHGAYTRGYIFFTLLRAPACATAHLASLEESSYREFRGNDTDGAAAASVYAYPAQLDTVFRVDTVASGFGGPPPLVGVDGAPSPLTVADSLEGVKAGLRFYGGGWLGGDAGGGGGAASGAEGKEGGGGGGSTDEGLRFADAALEVYLRRAADEAAENARYPAGRTTEEEVWWAPPTAGILIVLIGYLVMAAFAMFSHNPLSEDEKQEATQRAAGKAVKRKFLRQLCWELLAQLWVCLFGLWLLFAYSYYRRECDDAFLARSVLVMGILAVLPFFVAPALIFCVVFREAHFAQRYQSQRSATAIVGSYLYLLLSVAYAVHFLVLHVAVFTPPAPGCRALRNHGAAFLGVVYVFIAVPLCCLACCMVAQRMVLLRESDMD